MNTNNNDLNEKQCDCGKDKLINDLLKRISNLEFEVEDKDRENEKLNNIINNFEKWLDKKEKLTFNSWNKGIHEVQRKLQELKGSNNNE